MVSAHFPDRAPSLMSYLSIISKASSRYRWPSWVVYDINFRQATAGSGMTDWSNINSSLYSECFNGKALSAEGWCSFCYSTEHISENCASKPSTRKRPLSNLPVASPNPYAQPKRQSIPIICKKYNRFGGDCNFGNACKYLHACEICKQPGHPKSQCTKPGPYRPGM